MIQKLWYLDWHGRDPHQNLAIEEALLGSVDRCAILYLWQNANTVVIGKNQNPWKECKTTLLQREGGRLARRQSGGGAVYHDLGNLNFTILLPREDFDVFRQLGVILQALHSLGIPGEASGRNDLLVQGQKFSGNAFYKSDDAAYHHGTLLIHADLEKLSRYLSPSPRKLRDKGVDSVRSRVANLAQFCPGLQVQQVKAALIRAFSQVYGLPVEPMPPLPAESTQALTLRNRSWQWNYGKKLPFTCTLEDRFAWGSLEIELVVASGQILTAMVSTDDLDPHWPPALEAWLAGRRLDGQWHLPQIPHREEITRLLSTL